MKKVIISVLLGGIAANSWALRCNGALVEEGDSVAQVIAKCGEPKSVYSDAYGDKQSMSYDQGNGATETVQILNGRVVNIDSERN